MDPRLENAPQVAAMDEASFKHEFTDFLSRLAVECNWHVHNNTCFKHLKNGEQRGDATCRMRLDGSMQEITTIDPETGSIELRRWRGRVNNFTDLILFLMQCNTDTQFIGSGEAAKATVFYTTEYVTKSDLPLHVGLQALDYATKMFEANAQTETSTSVSKREQTLITKTVNAIMGKQEISHQQVMSYLVGGGDHYTSHVFHAFKWYEFVNAIQRSEELALAFDEQGEHFENEVFGETQLDEQVTVSILANKVEISSDIQDYSLQPFDSAFDKLSLWEFMERTIKEKGDITNRNDDTVDDGEDSDVLDSASKKKGRKLLPRAKFAQGHAQFTTHILRLHSKLVIPVMIGDAIPCPDQSDEEYELYC
jgi:hypothetical protein